MLINVCAHYCGTTILIDSFKTEEEAKEFMKHDYILYYADELENAEEDEIIYSNEMFIEDELPFFETQTPQIKFEDVNLDELPF